MVDEESGLLSSAYVAPFKHKTENTTNETRLDASVARGKFGGSDSSIQTISGYTVP